MTAEANALTQRRSVFGSGSGVADSSGNVGTSVSVRRHLVQIPLLENSNGGKLLKRMTPERAVHRHLAQFPLLENYNGGKLLKSHQQKTKSRFHQM